MKYDREKLYNEVWAEPVSTVSKRYGISNAALASYGATLWSCL